jgi:hypothetical protein
MSFHTPEAQRIKKKAIKKMLNQMAENMAQLEAGKKISSSQRPKMYLRMARLLAGTDDSVFIDTVDDLLAKGATGDQIKNKLRNISESVIPKKLKRLGSDRLHHGIPLEVLDPLMKQEPEVMLEFLQLGEADGRFFGDSISNINNSFQEQSHTGAFDRAKTSGINYPSQLQIGGDIRFSAHRAGTNKGLDPKLNRKYKSGSEMYEAMLPAIMEAEADLKIGIAADTPRRNKANELLTEQGLLVAGEDNWSQDMSPERIKANRTALEAPELGMQVAAAQNNYLMQDPELLRQAGITTADIDDVTARNQLKLVKAGGAMKLLPLLGLAGTAAAVVPNIARAKEAYAAGDTEQGNLYAANAAAETVGGLVGEIPIVGDVLVESVAGSAAGDGTKEGWARTQASIKARKKSSAAKIVDDPMNELEWAAKNPGEAIKNLINFVGGGAKLKYGLIGL